jgi:hypothetical protein
VGHTLEPHLRHSRSPSKAISSRARPTEPPVIYIEDRGRSAQAAKRFEQRGTGASPGGTDRSGRSGGKDVGEITITLPTER